MRAIQTTRTTPGLDERCFGSGVIDVNGVVVLFNATGCGDHLHPFLEASVAARLFTARACFVLKIHSISEHMATCGRAAYRVVVCRTSIGAVYGSGKSKICDPGVQPVAGAGWCDQRILDQRIIGPGVSIQFGEREVRGMGRVGFLEAVRSEKRIGFGEVAIANVVSLVLVDEIVAVVVASR